MSTKKKVDAETATARAEIASKAKDAVKDKRCINGILELLGNLDIPRSPTRLEVTKAVASLRALLEAFQKLLARGDLDEAKEDGADATADVSAWLRERYESFWKALSSLLCSREEPSLRDLSLAGAFRLIRASHQRKERRRRKKEQEEGEESSDSDRWGGEERRRLRQSVLPSLLSDGCCMSGQISRLKEFLDFVDVRQNVVQLALKILRARSKETKDLPAPLVRNVMCLLEALDFSEPGGKESEQDGRGPRTFLCVGEDGASHFAYDHESARKSFSDLWECFLRLRMDVGVYRRTLLMLDDKVMPHLARPLLLTDFLVQSYHVGGAISVLALGGVFALMQKHNLEYPDFYTKLYALFKPEILHVRYRARFLHMSDLFLTSTHLPEYLVAAFAKRTARIALAAPASALLAVLPFIGNLLIRHPGLLKMLHGREGASATTSGDAVNLEGDPYVPDEPDPAKCRAGDSSLWEILTLEQHVLPQVSQAAKSLSSKLRRPPEQRTEWDLSEFLELDMGDMMREECKKKIFVNVPLTFERPSAEISFAKDDLTSKHFKMV